MTIIDQTCMKCMLGCWICYPSVCWFLHLYARPPPAVLPVNRCLLCTSINNPAAGQLVAIKKTSLFVHVVPNTKIICPLRRDLLLKVIPGFPFISEICNLPTCPRSTSQLTPTNFTLFSTRGWNSKWDHSRRCAQRGVGGEPEATEWQILLQVTLFPVCYRI